MTRNVVAYLITLVVMVALDFVWLTQVGPRLYDPILHPIMLTTPRMSAVIAFYLLYVLGLTYFAVAPGIASGQWQTASLRGALFGFFAYATYDLTNHATLIIWSSRITLADMAWGTILSAIAASAATAVAPRIARATA